MTKTNSIIEKKPISKHTHNWLLKDSKVQYRDIDGKEFVIDYYVCECGAGGYVQTPKELFEKGFETLGITEGTL